MLKFRLTPFLHSISENPIQNEKKNTHKNEVKRFSVG